MEKVGIRFAVQPFTVWRAKWVSCALCVPRATGGKDSTARSALRTVPRTESSPSSFKKRGISFEKDKSYGKIEKDKKYQTK